MREKTTISMAAKSLDETWMPAAKLNLVSMNQLKSTVVANGGAASKRQAAGIDNHHEFIGHLFGLITQPEFPPPTGR